MALQGYYQNGYVTHDLDRAIELFTKNFGLDTFNRFDGELAFETPEGAKPATMSVATGWVGALQIELIQPISGNIEAYSALLPEDQSDATPQFHHVAVRRESIEEMRHTVSELGMPIVFENHAAGIDCMFVDTRKLMGHHFELVCASPEAWKMLGWPD